MACPCSSMEPDMVNSSVLIAGVNKCIEIIGKACFCNGRIDDEILEELVEKARYEVISLINQLKFLESDAPAMKPKEELETELFAAEYEITLVEEKLEDLRSEWRKQQDRLANLQEHLYQNEKMIAVQSNKASAQGAILAETLCSTFLYPDVMEFFLRMDKDFPVYLRIVDGTVTSFARVYSNETPLNNSPDYDFTIALFRGLSIVTKDICGRNFIMKCDEGEKMVLGIIRALPHIQFPSAEFLKIAMLEIVKNFSRDQSFEIIHRKCEDLPKALGNCINKPHSPAIYIAALNILSDHTKSIPNPNYLARILRNVEIEHLDRLSRHCDRNIVKLASLIVKRINCAENLFAKVGDANYPLGSEKPSEQEVLPSDELSCGCTPSEIPLGKSEPSYFKPPCRRIISEETPRSRSSEQPRVMSCSCMAAEGYRFLPPEIERNQPAIACIRSATATYIKSTQRIDVLGSKSLPCDALKIISSVCFTGTRSDSREDQKTSSRVNVRTKMSKSEELESIRHYDSKSRGECAKTVSSSCSCKKSSNQLTLVLRKSSDVEKPACYCLDADDENNIVNITLPKATTKTGKRVVRRIITKIRMADWMKRMKKS